MTTGIALTSNSADKAFTVLQPNALVLVADSDSDYIPAMLDALRVKD